MPPAARVTDMHTCPMVTGVVPHVGGPILPPGHPTTMIGFMPAARVGDMLTCVGPPDVILKGSATVLIGFMPAARIGDSTAHGGVIVVGHPTTMIGDSGGGGGGGAGAGAAGGAAGAAGAAVPDTYGNAIRIEGDEDFRRETIAALDEIGRTPTGRALLASLDASGQTIVIRESSGGNGAAPDDSSRAQRQSDGTPGQGTGSTVRFNPNTPQIGDGSEPWHTRPPGVGLGHELIHADHSAHGTNDFTAAGEDMAVGVPPYENESFTENAIRDEWTPRQPRRPHY